MAARLILLLALVVGAGGLGSRPARAETRPRYGGDITGTLLGEPASLDPIAARSHAELAVIGLVFDTLYRIGPDGVLVPHVAAALPVLDGGKARIPIRPGIRFHDGSALTVVDVVATLARVKASVSAGWLLAGVDAISADGDDVVLDLHGGGKDLAAILAAPQLAITPRGAAPKAGGAVGSGPFMLVSRAKDRLELEAFDDHFAGRPYVDHLTLRWFTTPDGEAKLYETGGSHWSMRGATVFSGQTPKFPTDELEGPATVLVYVGFGQTQAAITGNRDWRAALDAAMARGGLSAIGTGERTVPTLDPVPAELGGPALPEDARDSRSDAATAAMARAAAAVPALAADRRASVSLEVLIDASRPDDREVAERVVRALDKLGIRGTITAVAAPELARRVAAGACDLYIGQLAASVSNPGLLFAQAYAAAGDRDVADKLVAGGTVDLARARAAFAAKLPILPLFHRAVRVHHRRDLRGSWFDGASRLGVADLFMWDRP
ncbi:MAG TPA: ABC transporter substrate-binding protein [Kofleriaceae bacterium]|nr:ABC transporter substrate-binding protein [Kofleriaceae bacterium]